MTDSVGSPSGWIEPPVQARTRSPTSWGACCGRRRGFWLFRPVPWRLGACAAARAAAVRGAVAGKSRSCRRSSIWAPWNLALGDHATVSHDVDLYNAARIEIGPHATVSRRAFARRRMTLITRTCRW